MAGHTTFSLNWSMFKRERTLFVSVALDTGSVCSGRQSGLFCFETAVRVVAIRTTHYAFENLMMERLVELMLYFAVATKAKLGIAHLQQLNR